MTSPRDRQCNLWGMLCRSDAAMAGKSSSFLWGVMLCVGSGVAAMAMEGQQRVRNHKKCIVCIEGASLQKQDEIACVWTVCDLPSG